MTAFGKCYWYRTPDGRLPIGVLQGLGGTWIVAYVRPNGSRRRIKSPALQPSADPAELQEKLDAWADKNWLNEVQS